MHATWRGQTDFLDVLSMNMYMSGLLVTSIAFLFDWKKNSFYRTLLVVFSLDVFFMIFSFLLVGVDLFTALVVITFLSEVVLSLGVYSKLFKRFGARQIKRNTILLGIVLGLFLTAYWLWHFGLGNAPSCDPYALWQWHAVWHFITACCTILIAMYIRTEKEFA